MLFENHETTRLKSLLAQHAKSASKQELTDALTVVRKRKPLGLDSWSQGICDRYLGQQAKYVEDHLRGRFPETHSTMSRASLNYIKMIATNDAGVYGQRPDRAVEVNGSPMDPNTSKEIMDALDEASLDVKLGEMERRANASLVQFARVSWIVDEKIVGGGYCGISLAWPHQIGLAFHPLCSDFSSLRHAVLLVANTSSPDPAIAAYEIFSRQYDDASAFTGYGPWVRSVICEDGNVVADSEPIEGLLPWAILQLGEPSDQAWLTADTDLPAYCDTLNGDLAAIRLATDYGSSPLLAYYGTSLNTSQIVVGPSAVNKMGPSDRFEAVQINPLLAEMQNALTEATRALATTRGNSADAYAASSDAGALSGVARQIQNIPHERKLDGLRPIWKRFEERQLLPIVLNMLDLYSDIVVPANATVKMTPRKQPQLEDPEVKQRRLQAEVDSGWISPAVAATEMGRYATVEDAVEAGVSDKIKNAGTSAFASVLDQPLEGAPPDLFGGRK